MSAFSWIRIVAFAGVLGLAGGCTQDMYDQPRQDPLEASTFFSDGSSARPQVAGTIARDQLFESDPFVSGRRGNEFVQGIPAPPEGTESLPVNRATLERGQQRFNIYCAPCHSRTGAGDGIIVHRGFPKPPSLHEPRLRDEVQDGYLYDVIRNGFRRMPAYGNRIDIHDRWAIVLYVRALQRSQYVNLDEAPEDVLEHFQAPANTQEVQ